MPTSFVVSLVIQGDRRAIETQPGQRLITEYIMDDRDIWRSAKALIDSYGDDATIHAAMRADELLAQGDIDGAGTWRRVLDAVKELERTEPRGAGNGGCFVIM